MDKELNFTKMQTPDGTKDYLPNEVKKKKYLERKIESIFTRWGYEEVITPSIEFFAALSVGTGQELQQKMYKLFDRNGHILALRPEMTAPIARLVANRLNEAPRPLRLSYQANVFKYETPQAGRQREFYQAGIELIGVEEKLADAEIVAIAVEVLQQVGLENFSLDIGQIDYLTGLMGETSLTEEMKNRFRRKLAQKDFVGLERLVKEIDLTSRQKKAILTLPDLRGGKEIIDQARELVDNQESKSALNNLEKIYKNLELLGVADYINLDLNIIRGFNYYTGMVFEGYTKDLGFTICGGGRYDNLLEQFGDEGSATGFAVGIDRLLIALENQNIKLPIKDDKIFLLYDKDKKQTAIDLAKKLRREGKKVVLEIMDRDLDNSIEYAFKKNLNQLIYLGSKDSIGDRDYEVDTLYGQEVFRLN
ncbi:ATP phosphoribosyltransferase regulatory subunit [Sporohalobacter salinus]|uniref:ATP phosphoribosyltransferase regulatory subunit n=1 Tax=Sporohalobacter salinus TaxID=1494606 RepID=UPI0019603A74|nr:ATP phosphoribosyltransferase regulatory subunit [Sporohalobacter salinus]MBM7623285.1 ATP phosphoribosyltransferase regulatory subunit [Sporohalobacter salinus]